MNLLDKPLVFPWYVSMLAVSLPLFKSVFCSTSCRILLMNIFWTYLLSMSILFIKTFILDFKFLWFLLVRVGTLFISIGIKCLTSLHRFLHWKIGSCLCYLRCLCTSSRLFCVFITNFWKAQTPRLKCPFFHFPLKHFGWPLSLDSCQSLSEISSCLYHTNHPWEDFYNFVCSVHFFQN